jgi:GMP synthase-like glutamine amidotransferase
MRVLVIQHDHVSPPGPVGERFEQRGYEVVPHTVVAADRFHSPWVEPSFPDFVDFDAVVTLGAPWSTYDATLVDAWVGVELEQLRRADSAGVPVLGICFGGQLLATAFGGAVHPCPFPEVGWTPVRSVQEEVVASGPWFHWHYDHWTVPPGAREIARSTVASQAFALRRNLAVQFHPELTSATLAGWLANGATTKALEHGYDPLDLVRRTRAWDAAARRRAHDLVDGFLDHVAGPAPAVAHGCATMARAR